MSVLRVDLLRLRYEALSAMANTGASSVFWLALAFAMPVASYGRIMTLQAAIYVVGYLLTFRTHDLVFFLVRKHEYQIDRAFRFAIGIEVLSTGLAVLITAIGATVYFGTSEAGVLFAFAGYALIAGIGTSQGASIAVLRYHKQDTQVVRSDVFSLVAWAGACVWIVVSEPRGMSSLIVGALPPLFKTLWLATIAFRVAGAQADRASPPGGLALPSRADLSRIGHYLGAGQIANFAKNATVSIETIIVAAIFSPAIVGMYRVIRAITGAAGAVLNVGYQRAFPVLARAADQVQMRLAKRNLERQSGFIWLMTYPLPAVAAAAYAYAKPEVGFWEVQALCAGIFLSQIPVALQQGSFATISLEGRPGLLSAGYLLSLATLSGLFVLLLAWPRIDLLLLGLIASNGVRMLWLYRKSEQILDAKIVLSTVSGRQDSKDEIVMNMPISKPLRSLEYWPLSGFVTKRQIEGWSDEDNAARNNEDEDARLAFLLYKNEKLARNRTEFYFEKLGVPIRGKILEQGAGICWLSSYLSKFDNVEEIISVELNEKRVLAFRELALSTFEGVSPEKLRYAIGDMHRLEVEDNTLDLVVCDAVLHHADNLIAMLRESWRALKPGGWFVALREPEIPAGRSKDPVFDARYPENGTAYYYYRAGWKSAFLNAWYVNFRTTPFFDYGLVRGHHIPWTARRFIRFFDRREQVFPKICIAAQKPV